MADGWATVAHEHHPACMDRRCVPSCRYYTPERPSLDGFTVGEDYNGALMMEHHGCAWSAEWDFRNHPSLGGLVAVAEQHLREAHSQPEDSAP